MQRRIFLKESLTAIAASACAPLFPSKVLASTPPKHILVLGGTKFLGPALVESAIAAGHTVTLFNRGVTNPDLFPHIEKLRGFRSASANDQDLSALTHRQFDVAVDVWPNDPAVVASAAEFLKDRIGHYLYVSSIAAYDSKEFDRAGIEENAPMQSWNSSGRPYNRGKAESERRLHGIVGEKTTIVRPGPIKGTRDTTPDLLTWLVRAQDGGLHIGPGDGGDSVELVDVKDVARFLVLAIDRALPGTFNLTGKPMRFREFLDACKAATGSDARFEWIPLEFLRAHGLETDSALNTFSGNFPLWRPVGAQPGLFLMSSEKAFGVGWKTRPFRETALDCLYCFRSLREHLDWDDYLTADKEKQVLNAWEHRTK
ncbi:MAG TPA: NAD-dependent epimerase/dehydratase family protein [Steroidobacteraceae bacterium]|jgi:2'-hydroxyisoflavone reductase|nr:NAD-dependent epimerase/dehydratase family protein [Steroidobacteraceae bacterium]